MAADQPLSSLSLGPVSYARQAGHSIDAGSGVALRWHHASRPVCRPVRRRPNAWRVFMNGERGGGRPPAAGRRGTGGFADRLSKRRRCRPPPIFPIRTDGICAWQLLHGKSPSAPVRRTSESERSIAGHGAPSSRVVYAGWPRSPWRSPECKWGVGGSLRPWRKPWSIRIPIANAL